MSDSTLGYAIIGAGNIGAVHAQALAHVPGTRLACVADSTREKAEALAGQYGGDWCGDFLSAVNRADVDVVCICTPSGAHVEPGVAAAEAGKHLVIEKPLDVTLERVDRLLDAARMAGVKTTCVLPYRFLAGSRRAYEAIQAGRLGRITLAEARVPWWRSQAYYDAGGWRGTVQFDGGGALLNQALHAIDLMLWLVGRPVWVSGRVATLAHRMETEDTGVAALALASGALAVLTGGTGCYPGDPATIAVYGDKGTIILQEGRIKEWRLADAAPGEAEAMRAEDQLGGSGSGDPSAIGFEMHRRQLADFTEAIVHDRRPFVTGPDGRPCLEAIAAVYESARTGQAVSLERVS